MKITSVISVACKSTCIQAVFETILLDNCLVVVVQGYLDE